MLTPSLHRRGFMCVLSSPSGAGKTTLSKLLLQQDDHLEMSVSATTRTMRPGEENGTDYYFISQEEFIKKREAGDFLEYAEVFGHHYGTPKDKVAAVIKDGRDILFDIDWQGTLQLATQAPEDVVSIFILPPSLKELERRLHYRAQDNEAIIQTRMSKAASEISHWNSYDYVLVNKDLDETLHLIQVIIQAERVKRKRQQGLTDFVQKLLNS
ncbi:MAG: guanylate kinase [Alphaproteobacteria bacterium]|nr:guanylate kinase [Alphaproteobacteria bacterium]